MESVLVHRGGELRVLETAWGTVGVRSHTADGAATPRLVEEAEGAFVLSGHLLGHDFVRSEDLMEPPWRGPWVAARVSPRGVELGRDAVGARSVYWGRLEHRLLFGSEPKVVSQAPGFMRSLRVPALAQYLTFSFVPTEETMIEGVFQLRPGETVRIDPEGRARAHRWFRYEESEGQREQAEEAWVEEFRALHGQAVRERLVGAEPIAFLSGGLDSSAVVAEMREQGVQPLETFTIHFGADHPNELDFAREVAQRCETQHEEVCIAPADFVPRLEKAIWHLDEPIGDPVTIPNFELARQVAGHGMHVFNGEGGDPLFGGPKNLTMMLHHVYGGVARAPGFRERSYLASYRRAFEEIPHLLTEDVLRQIDAARDLESVLTPYFEAACPKSLLHKLLTINTRLKGAHLILPKIERMLGAWGLTPMSPLFDERIVRLSLAMPERLKLAGAVEKVVIKRAYADAIPESVIRRPKSGMRVPVHYWFRGAMREVAEELLSERALREGGLFRPERVRQLLDYEVEEGPGRYGLRLWMLLTFELWRRTLLV